jgi:Zn-dependent protease
MSEQNKTKVGLWALLGKFGSKVLSLLAKALKALKFTKVGLAGLSFAGYAAIYTWKFALVLLVAVGFHESGHVWAMKRMGMRTKGFYFLPFLGGAAIAEDSYTTYGQNAFVAIMGPVWGALLALVCSGLYLATGNPMWAAASAWMAMLNLFNLLPVTPLDGGQIVRSIAFSIHHWVGRVFLIVSLAFGTYLMFKLKIGLFAILLIVASLELLLEFRNRNKLEQVKQGLLRKWALPDSLLREDPETGEIVPVEHPTAMSKGQLVLTFGSYVLLTVVLVYIMIDMEHIPGADIARNFLE